MLPFLIVDTALYLPDLDVARYTTYPLAPLTFFHFSVACFLPAVTVTAGGFRFYCLCRSWCRCNSIDCYREVFVITAFNGAAPFGGNSLYTVIIRSCFLCLMRKPGSTAVLINLQLFGHRHNGELSVVIDPGTGWWVCLKPLILSEAYV